MAYVLGQDEEEKDEAAGQATPQAAASTGGAPVPAAAPKAPKAGGFVDIRRLMNANQGQGQQLAQRATTRVENAANRAQGALQQAQGAYQQKVQAATPQGFSAAAPVYTPPPMPQVARGAVATTAGAPGMPRVASGPVATTAPSPRPAAPVLPDTSISAADRAAAEAAATAGYSGPNTVQDTGQQWADAQRAFVDAKDAFGALGREGGVSALVGGGALEDLLAGGAGRAASRRFEGLRKQFEGAAKDTSVADAARKQAEQSRAGAQRYLTDADKAQAALDLRRTDEMNNAESSRLADEDLWERFSRDFYPAWQSGAFSDDPGLVGIRGVNPNDEASVRRWFDANKDRVRARLGRK